MMTLSIACYQPPPLPIQTYQAVDWKPTRMSSSLDAASFRAPGTCSVAQGAMEDAVLMVHLDPWDCLSPVDSSYPLGCSPECPHDCPLVGGPCCIQVTLEESGGGKEACGGAWEPLQAY